MSAPLTLNVIYTPDSALLLARFAATLLRWSDCRVRRVANGCTAEECAHLEALAAREARYTFLALPTATTWSHSAVLDWLHDGCEERYFAFVDSDLFAVGPFMPADLTADLTCLLPPAVYWDALAEQQQPYRHRMGCTYFAIYDSARLHAVRRQWGVGFAKQRWERLTGDQQAALDALGYRKQRYDTGKLLNALLVAGGGRVAFGDAANVRHLGGVSRATLPSSTPWLRQSLRAWRGERSRRQVGALKQQTGAYFGALLAALAAADPLPPLPRLADRYVAGKVAAVSAAIVALMRSATA